MDGYVRLSSGERKTCLAILRGDRTTCLHRDLDVVITTWTDARIAWPRCRVMGPSSAGSGLLVCSELARAIKTESAAAIMHWWVVGLNAVWRWRKGFGVARVNIHSSNRLVRVNAKNDAE
jgi:hypothetical protein